MTDMLHKPFNESFDGRIAKSPEEIDSPSEHSMVRAVGRASLEGMTLARRAEHHPLDGLKSGLKEAIVGQDEAVDTIVTALSSEQLRDTDKTMANLLFLGPNGVGKSEMAKELANQLGSDLIRIDLAALNYANHAAAMMGEIPSYVGANTGPLLNPEIAERDQTVILFEGVERGGAEMWQLMRQILEDGELAMVGQNKTISFKNSIIIATSNLGADEVMKASAPRQIGFQSMGIRQEVAPKGEVNKAALTSLGHVFKSGFTDLFDSKVVFQSLDEDSLGEVLDRHVTKSNERYIDAGVSLELSPELRSHLSIIDAQSRHGGARPMIHKYNQVIESRLAEYINTGSIPEGSRVYATYNEDGEIDLYYEADTELQSHIEELRRAEEEARLKEMWAEEPDYYI